MKELYFYRVVMVCLVLGGTFLAGHHYGHSTFDHLAHLTGQSNRVSFDRQVALDSPSPNLNTTFVGPGHLPKLQPPANLNSPSYSNSQPLPLITPTYVGIPTARPGFVPRNGQLQYPARASFAQPQLNSSPPAMQPQAILFPPTIQPQAYPSQAGFPHTPNQIAGPRFPAVPQPGLTMPTANQVPGFHPQPSVYGIPNTPQNITVPKSRPSSRSHGLRPPQLSKAQPTPTAQPSPIPKPATDRQTAAPMQTAVPANRIRQAPEPQVASISQPTVEDILRIRKQLGGSSVDSILKSDGLGDSFRELLTIIASGKPQDSASAPSEPKQARASRKNRPKAGNLRKGGS